MKKHFKLLVTLCILAFALAISAFATDFTGYTKISTADELLGLMNSTSAVTGKYYLANNIDLTGKTQSPIGEPSGKSFGTKTDAAVFDGNGYTVSGIDISGGNYMGFFGVVENAEIRNLTVKGKISSSGSNCAGLVAYAKTSIVIENCVNECSVTGTAKGTCFGGILGNTELSSMVNLTVFGCTNNGTVSAYRVIGGIAGLIQRAKNCEILIEKCVNNGTVTATCTSADSKVGGILGASNRGNTVVTVKSFAIKKCMNTAKIEGYFYVGGIIGELCGTDATSANAYTNAKFSISECFNSGNVVSTRATNKEKSMTGGIIGYISQIGNVTDCLNTGTVSAQLHHVGGLFGHIPKDSDFFGAKNNLNRGTVLLKGEAVTTNDYVNSIGGFMPYKPYGVNYYTGTLQGKVWTNTVSGASSTQYTEDLFDDLNESGNWVNPAEPMLNEFKSVSCAHASVVFSASGNSIVFTCDTCDEEIYTDTTILTTVYVDSENGKLAQEGKDIGAATAPFKSLEEAFEYVAVASAISDTDAKIIIVGEGILNDTYETPQIAKTITVTGGTFHFGGAKIANRHLNLGGPLVFENITFTSAATEARINAQNNKLVMGEGIVMGNATSTTKVNASIPFAVNDVKMFVSGGFYENIPEKMATDITIRSGEYYIISGWNITNSKAPTMGTAKITVGKTNENDTLKICDLVAFSTVAQTRLTADSTATMIIDGDADIARLIMSERETTTNTVAANYTTHLVLRGAISESYRNAYKAPYGFDVTGGAHSSSSLGYHTFRIFTDERVEGAVHAEHAFFGGDGFAIDETLTTGGYKPVEVGGDVTMTQHSYKEYCVNYLDGHKTEDGDTICDECGADTACTHANAVPVVVIAPNCSETGYEYTFCHDCGIMVSERELPTDENSHEYVWEAFEGGYRYVCVHSTEHIYCIYDHAVTEFFVSDDGKADGGFSASYPSNDFDAMMKLAAANSNDVTVYILGTVTLADNDETDYEVYIEPEHANTITVRGYKANSGIVRIGSRDTRLEYVLSGDTTFSQIEFNTGISKNAFYITARHNSLVMGERISTNFGRYNGDSTANSGKLIVIGGCDNTIDSSACAKEDTDITLLSGTYYMVVGGSSLKTCGLVNGTINIKVLGDITVGGIVTNKNGFVDRQFILGSHSADAGDIIMIIDGNITCTNAFCIGSYGVKTVKDVTIIIKGGSLSDYSFSGRSESAVIYDEEFAQVYDPTAGALETATAVIFPLGNTHSHAIRGGVMNFVDNVYINYNADIYSTVHLAERFRLSLGGSDNFHMDVIPDNPCISADGRHTPSGIGIIVLASTCRGAGSMEHTCAICGKTYYESIDRLPHEFGEEELFSNATCTSPEMYVRVCGNDGCGFKEFSSSGEATNIHVFENGLCKYCTLNKQDICKHENLSEVRNFTSGCGTGTKQTCLDCEKDFINIEGADHKFGSYTVTVEPTETTPGVKSRTCRNCGKVETALLYSDGDAAFNEAMATNQDGSLSDVSVNSLRLSKAEKAALDALLQNTDFGSEVKVSYVARDAGTDIVYSIPLPAEYADMQNLKVIVKDDEGNLHHVEFKIEKGYIVFTF